VRQGNRFLVALIFDGVAGGATGVAVVAGRATLAAGVDDSAAKAAEEITDNRSPATAMVL
jgi:hypothetical protein